ncbi:MULTISPECIES: MBL fold metallo-hydrolase [unclassified Arthrobacter]|uniref:MBL fold metallo-hydrolase n=1 Tax=unclassified Arthrobacter TaxID=235627 RepID=UPI001E601E15|nr:MULTISPECIES: MBL fold metallo-hydrolase [unclassified Arthrobacter]MCC9145519.1 MBL fold metallo-hydrolase [Arthrobacter sp. zg-Y919]MDK1276747.1 MBL fold metallo-hydrolase [Arthrobacter sp. zg.Y919]WIB04310.1 MBL fold metallo-hydrolase [Arthrobacter sp. zg-Y919]
MRLGPHLHRIGNDIVAAYLVDTEDGVTVIDTGLPGHWEDLLTELQAMGRPLDDVRGAILTHGDSDHVGFAEKLRQKMGIPVFVHSLDAERARGGNKPKTTMGPWRVFPLTQFALYGLRKRGWRPKYLAEVTEVADGDVLPLPGSPRVIGMPGHSPGSIAVHVPAADAVFVGDALTTRHVLTGVSGIQPAPFTDDPDAALDSLGRLAGVEASWVLPGHGAPWRGNPEALQDLARLAMQQTSKGEI